MARKKPVTIKELEMLAIGGDVSEWVERFKLYWNARRAREAKRMGGDLGNYQRLSEIFGDEEKGGET